MRGYEKKAILFTVALILLVSGLYLVEKPEIYSEKPIPEVYYLKDSLEALHWNRSTYVDSIRHCKLDTVKIPYRDLFEQYADSLGLDWRMLAAVAWHESGFDLNARSRRGAMGLMQIMPVTAERFGISDLHDPSSNIHAATLLLMHLTSCYKGISADRTELFRYTMGAYNAGQGRIKKCIEACREKGMEPHTWDDIVNIIPEIEDFIGSETIAYVDSMTDAYKMFLAIK